MKNRTVFIKVKVKDRMPSKKGTYITNIGLRRFDPEKGEFDQSAERVGWSCLHRAFKITYWFEEIELPSEGEIQSVAPKTRCVNQFWNGANFILNKLKGETK